MKSIRTRILSLVLLCVLLSNLVVMIFGITSVARTVDSDSAEVIGQISKEKVQELNAQLLLIEQSVSTLHEYIVHQMEKNPDDWMRGEALEEHLEQVHEIAELSIRHTQGALSVYYHLTPAVGASDVGIYITQASEGEYTDYPVTDVTSFTSGNDSESSWYLEPLRAGNAVWLQPYHNTAVDAEIISYVIPVTFDGEIYGVVGMDIDLEMLRQLVNSVQVYDSGYAILLDPDGNLVYHPDYPTGLLKEDFPKDFEKTSPTILKAQMKHKIVSYRWTNGMKKILCRELRNGMFLGITVPIKEIRQPTMNFAIFAILFSLAVIGVCFLLSAKVAAVIVKPLQELTKVSQRLAGGDLDVKIYCPTGDEVEVLAESIQDTAKELKKYVASINEFARTDSLTNVWNKTAYQEQVELLEKDIAAGTAEFSVAVLDVNNLKHMNDTYGHEAGDFWIKNAARAIERSFGRSRVYRIGGDEFVAIFEPKGRRHYDRMLTEFHKELEQFNQQENKKYTEQLYVACGIADYDKAKDQGYMDVFRRADNEMYENKKYLKGLL